MKPGHYRMHFSLFELVKYGLKSFARARNKMLTVSLQDPCPVPQGNRLLPFHR